MAKLTKHIRLVEYNITSNQFEIGFHFKGDNELFGLRVTYDFDRDIIPTNYTAETFDMLGFSTSDVDNILGEIFDWMNQPRARLADQSYGDLMRTRIDLTKRIEKERRAKVAVERIVAEAPPLDWAMSIYQEIERQDDAVEAGDKLKQFRAAGGRWVTPERGSLTLPHYFSTRLNDESPATKALQQSMKSVGERIAAMEAVGFGEEPAKVEVPAGWEVAPPDERPTIFIDALNAVIPKLVDEVRCITGMPFTGYSGEKQALTDAFRRTFDGAFKIATADRPQRDRDAEETRYQHLRKIADERTEHAVTSIHKQVRRFMAPASMREHDFLRSIIQEEIENVVEGVL